MSSKPIIALDGDGVLLDYSLAYAPLWERVWILACGKRQGRLLTPRPLERLAPVAFVDDHLRYFRGVAPGIHRALICRGPNGTPNVGPELDTVHSLHADLWQFSEWATSLGEAFR